MGLKKNTSKDSVSEKSKKQCFVIMPFGGWFDTYYKEVYCPAVSKSGLEIHRADDLFAPNNIVKDIWEYTQKADIILADLSGKNPNVFYELGLAHAIAKPVILISEAEDDIPFDLRAIRILLYDKNVPNWGEELKSSIEKAIKEILKNPKTSVPATFLKEIPTIENQPISKSDKDILEIRQELELLRRDMRFSEIRPGIPPEQAREMIKKYIEEGLSAPAIVNRVSRFGPPRRWIEQRIVEIKNTENNDVPFS